MECDSGDNTTTLCRICFEGGEYNITSYELEIEQEKFGLKTIFKELSALETWNMESSPSMMCSSCTDQLGQCYSFLKKLRNADEKIKQMYSSVDSIPVSESIGSPEEVNYEIIECLEEKDIEEEMSTVNVLEECISISSEMNADSRPELEKKAIKRKKSNDEDEIAGITQQPPIKITKESNEGNCFLITKFVPTQATILPDANGELGRDDLLTDPTTVNQVRMFDMAAVEVNASGKIEFTEEDDETNIENPNTMYMCQYCPRAFATSHHLIMHQRKSHVCQFCMKGFVKVSDLHKHSKEAHSQFNCAFCKKDFSSNSNLRQHMKRIHNVELPAHVSLLSYRKKDTST